MAMRNVSLGPTILTVPDFSECETAVDGVRVIVAAIVDARSEAEALYLWSMLLGFAATQVRERGGEPELAVRMSLAVKQAFEEASSTPKGERS